MRPRTKPNRLWVHQLQLTITDLVVQIHDTHHPVSGWLYFEEQIPAAKRRTADFWKYRVPKFLGYFERMLDARAAARICSAAGSATSISACSRSSKGCATRFPRRMKRFEKKVPRVIALHDRVAKRPRIAAYLASDRRIPFSQWGIYRYFKQLDG